MGNRAKVLMIAYACNPEGGGWNYGGMEDALLEGKAAADAILR
jgi:hypothetical protein